jgi:hypothetical protein
MCASSCRNWYCFVFRAFAWRCAETHCPWRAISFVRLPDRCTHISASSKRFRRSLSCSMYCTCWPCAFDDSADAVSNALCRSAAGDQFGIPKRQHCTHRGDSPVSPARVSTQRNCATRPPVAFEAPLPWLSAGDWLPCISACPHAVPPNRPTTLTTRLSKGEFKTLEIRLGDSL